MAAIAGERHGPRICLLGASFGTNNMGVNALTAGAIKAFFLNYPAGELFLLDYSREPARYTLPAGDSTASVELVNIRFSKKLFLANNIAFLLALALIARLIPFRSVREALLRRNFRLKRILDADIAVSIAGGDSFSDIYGMVRFLYVSLPQALVLLLGRKLVLLPQTIGPFKSTAARIMARAIMKRAAAVYSRDREGVASANDLLGAEAADGKVRFCYDVGFVVDAVRPQAMDLDGLQDRIERDRPVVGLNVSGLLFTGGYTHNNMFGLGTDYRQLVHEIIEHLIIRRGATVLLVPHVFGAKCHIESDSTACELVYAELKKEHHDRLFLVRGSYDQGEIKYIIGRCDMFVGSRMHACIAALSQAIPAVGIAYSRKFIGVLESIGAGFGVADPRKLSRADILAVIDRVYAHRRSIKGQLEHTLPGVHEAVLRLFPDIVNTVAKESGCSDRGAAAGSCTAPPVIS